MTISATIVKELLELRRDRAGLLVLLVMPMALVLIVSLVQDSVMQATGQAPIRVLFVDRDTSFLGAAIASKLKAAGGLDLISNIEGQTVSEDAARKAVIRGDFQFAVIIPAGTGVALKERVSARARAAIVKKGSPEAGTKAAIKEKLAGITICFDPAVQSSFRTAVVNALHRVVLGIEFQEQITALAETFPTELKKTMSGMMNPFMATPVAPEIGLKMDTAPVMMLTEEVAYNSRLLHRPTAAQQNVPAWALFGMFFIVVPLSGALIRERQTGTWKRVMTMPVSPLGLLTGKLCAYVLVCLLQFMLMLAAGRFVLPLLGTSGLVIDHQLLNVGVIAFAAALAATGYGIMVGTLAKTYEQASMFGSVSVVIAAALGGIMIPVYVMPRYMQDISRFSPLAWGLNAFQDIFVRGGELRAAYGDLLLLLLFFITSITVAWLSLSRNRSA